MPGPRARGSLLESVVLAVPGLLLVALFLLWAAGEGAVPPTIWYPGALFVLAVVAVLAGFARQLVPRPSVWMIAAIALLGAFAGWSFLSITWADVRADAWEGANRTLLYVLVYGLFALWPWRSLQAALALGAFSVGAAALGVFSLVRASASSDPGDFFIDARFVEPLEYANAESAFFLFAFWPALVLASRREVPVPLRGLMLGAAGVLLELAVLPQSRGAAFSFPVALALFFLLVPGRVRTLVALLPVAAVVLLAREPLLDLYTAVEGGADPAEALTDARNAVAFSFGALVLSGLGLALADRRFAFGERRARLAGLAVGALAALTALAAVAALFLAVESPGSRIAGEWNEFKAGYEDAEGATRFSQGVGSNRYDFWRVALGEFTEEPLVGIGADNFSVPYIAERASPEETRYPHSLQVMVLSQTGVVGAMLFAGFLVCALVAAAKRASGESGFGRVLTAVAVVAFAYWFVHASIDWFWEVPALTAPALAWLGIAGSRQAAAPRAARSSRLLSRLGVGMAALLVLLAAAATFSFPWLAARDVARASTIWREEPEHAVELLERARRLNPLSDRADSIAGAVASRREEWSLMRDAFSRALERNPANWYTELELALAYMQLGREERALRHLAEAASLNPREPIIDEIRMSLQEGRAVDPAEIDRRFILRAEERLR